MSFILSICIPTYNRKERIVETVKSFLASEIKEVQLCVLDNASQDGTYEELSVICDERFKLRRNNENIGQVRNQIKALFMGDGDFITPVMDRDVIDITKLQSFLNFLYSYEYDLIMTWSCFLREKKEITKKTSGYIATIMSHPSFITFKRDILFRDWTENRLKKIMLAEEELVLPWPTVIILESYWDKRILFDPSISWTKEKTEGTQPGYSGKKNGHQLYYMPQAGAIRLKYYCSIQKGTRKEAYYRNLAVYASELLRSTVKVYYHTRTDSSMRIRYGFRHVRRKEYSEAMKDMCAVMFQYGQKQMILSPYYYYKVVELYILNKIRINILVDGKYLFLRKFVIYMWEKQYFEMFL